MSRKKSGRRRIWPAAKGVEFRRPGRQSADVLFAKIEAMPPAAPGSLGAERHANLLAYLMSQNQLIPSARQLPSDIDQLRTMLLPGATGGPSGGLSPNAVLPPGPAVVNPLDAYTPVPTPVLQTPRAAGWPTSSGYDGQGFSPLSRLTRTTSHAASSGELACPTVPTKARPCFMMAYCSCTPTATSPGD